MTSRMAVEGAAGSEPAPRGSSSVGGAPAPVGSGNGSVGSAPSASGSGRSAPAPTGGGVRSPAPARSFICSFPGCDAAFNKGWRLDAHLCRHTGAVSGAGPRAGRGRTGSCGRRRC